MKKPAAAITPRKPSDPTGLDRLERAAIREFERRFKHIAKGYIELLKRIPAEPVVNKRYSFRLDEALIASVLSQGELFVDGVLLEGGEYGLWFYAEYVEKAYTTGLVTEWRNLTHQSPAYAAAVPSPQSLLHQQAVRNRMALVQARQFELMKGVTGRVKSNLARVLTEGIANGKNPLDIAKTIEQTTGIEATRSRVIARTEVTTALRRARWDEHEQAKADYGLKMMMMHFSALLATTRPSHAARHGKLFTTDQVQDWYSMDGNSINCRCIQTSVMVDDNGNPLNDRVVKRAQELREKFEESLDE